MGPILECSEIVNDWVSPVFWTFNTIISEVIPVIALLFSFWYGLGNRNKVISNRKYSHTSYRNGVPTSPNFWEQADDDEFYTENAFGTGSMSKISFGLKQERDYSIISNRDREGSV